MNRRFTVDGSDALEASLAQTCERVAAGVRRLIPANELEGLLLAGGYGRGEGGVLRTPDGDKPYNDMEFYVFVQGFDFLIERKYRSSLHELGEELSPAAELEVEFKAMTLDKLRKSPVNMFYYDIALGHRWVLGDDKLLSGCEQHQDPSGIPLHEATRLMFNRCSGLLYSKVRLLEQNLSQTDADFVSRNCAKAKLAFGDALLAANGRYHWSARERGKRLAESIPNFDADLLAAIRRHHAVGVDFKLYPKQSDNDVGTLRQEHAELCELGARLWLWIEEQRLAESFASPLAYALSDIDKCPETSALRNRLVNAKAFGFTAALKPSAARYPRERLFNALALLLWTENAVLQRECLAVLQSNLRTESKLLPELVKAYESLWHYFN
jgi:hypothetical protein